MKIELNIDASNFGGTIEKVFESLSEQDKKDLAKEVMAKYLLEDYQAERLARSQDIIRELREKGDNTYRNNSEEYKNKTDEEIMKTYQFNDRIKHVKTSKEEMIKLITDTALYHYKELVTKAVQEDPQLKEVYSKVRDLIEESYPGYVHDAMVKAFTEYFRTTQDALINQNHMYNSFQNDMNNLRDRLNIPRY
jgi:hypothetical protein